MESRAMKFLASLLLLLLHLGLSSGANRPIAVKTVQSEDGDVFDCIDINKQPSLGHPLLLKNHTIQRSPSSYPAVIKNEISSIPSSIHIKMESIECPSGTIPIRRAQNADFISHKSFMKLGINSNAEDCQDPKVQYLHSAVLETSGTDMYYGTRASINVYGLPQININQSTAAGITILDSGCPHKDLLTVGWVVEPVTFGDSNSRFFVGWINSSTGQDCYNHLCPGFVQVSSDIALGAKISPLSTYNGKQYHITLLIFKDPKTENWWVTYGENNKPIGYWPKSMFSSLRNEAPFMQWGGVTSSDLGIETPPMGSGHFASEGFSKAAYVRHIEIVDKNNNLIFPKWRNYAALFDRRCYEVDRISDEGGNIGLNFYFGGPGGCKL